MHQTDIVLIEDCAILREALSLVLNREPCLNVAGENSGGEKSLALRASLHADMAVDLSSRDTESVQTVNNLKQAYAKMKVIAVTYGSEEDQFCPALGLAGCSNRLVWRPSITRALAVLLPIPT
jgi:DNA-binding NarL/FixJ family response regulator